MPHRVGDSLSNDPAEQLSLVLGHRRHRGRKIGFDAGGAKYFACGRQLGGQTHLAIAGNGGSDIGQALTGKRRNFAHLVRRPVRIDAHEALGQLGFDRDGGQGVAEQVVQIAADAQPSCSIPVIRSSPMALKSCVRLTALRRRLGRQRHHGYRPA